MKKNKNGKMLGQKVANQKEKNHKHLKEWGNIQNK